MFYLNMVDYPMFFLLMSTWICAEQVEGVILSGWGGSVVPWDFSDSQEAKFPFSFGFDWDLAWELSKWKTVLIFLKASFIKCTV